jgi:hypothetical protein
MSIRLLLIAMLASFAGDACAQNEEITHYGSEIEVRADGSLRVTETIEVIATGDKIKRGIYRDFPTMYKTKHFIRVDVPFDVQSVKRDGKSEPFHKENRENGVRVYIGNKARNVPPGQHVYEIVYETDFQLGYFDDHDELYWNATGNGWEFPILSAEAIIKLPADIPRDELKLTGYTGPTGSRAQDLTFSVDAETGVAHFQTTKPLAANEGLTIVTSWPKGHVSEPTAAELTKLYARAIICLVLVAGTLLLLFVYFFAAWIVVGRDPPGGVIYPQFEPPQNLSPASARFIRRMHYDRQSFTSAILNMAVKGYLSIKQDDDEFTLKVADSNSLTKLSADEKAIANKLLKTRNSITVKQTNHKTFSSAIASLGDQLKKQYVGTLFIHNSRWLIPGWLIGIAGIVVSALYSGWATLPLVGFFSMWLSIWTLGTTVLVMSVLSSWKTAISLKQSTGSQIASFGGALFLTLFATPFVIAEIVVGSLLVYHTSILMVPLIIGVVTLNWLFWYLLKQPTVEGQRIRDEIEGFRMYLSAAEKEYLQRMHPPDKTPELYEEYLPYALALDVENQWAEQFEDVLTAASQGPANSGKSTGYHPRWYQGNNFNSFATGAVVGGLATALGGAIASAATAPGSRGSSSGGGFSGGGSSGGGGGGGGGGGW